jgi:hypothetical protein
METVKILLFEEPIAIYWLLFFAELTTLLMLYVRRTRRWAVVATLPAILAATVALLSWAVTTDRERLQLAVVELADAAQEAGPAGMTPWIDDSYADRKYKTKAELVAAAERVAKAFKLRRVTLADVTIDVKSSRAEAAFRATIFLLGSGTGRDLGFTRWRTWWVLRPDGWRLTSALLEDPPSLPDAPQGP